MSDERGPRWRSICGAEVVWDRWGFGVEFSFMHWAPPEISMYTHVAMASSCSGVRSSATRYINSRQLQKLS